MSLDEHDLEMLKGQRDRLLSQKTIIMAALDAETGPEMGVTPFIRFAGALAIYPSRLSAHVRALLAVGLGQFLLVEDEGAAQNLWARKRLKFNADVKEIRRDDPYFGPMCDAFLATHGSTMNLIRDFTDFHMLRIEPKSGVLVTGFGKAFALRGPDFVITDHLKSG